MNFSVALRVLKAGKKIARAGWNGKNMWLQLVEMDYYSVLPEKIDGIKTGPEWNLLPWIGMKTSDDKFVPWLASQTDILAEDWEVI
jgi:hypothetical protein